MGFLLYMSLKISENLHKNIMREVLRNIEWRGTCSKSLKRETISQHKNKY